MLSRFFDKAAIITGEKGAAAPTSPWRLCTVSQVEELKMLLRLLPVWASMVLFFAVSAQTVTTFIEQARVMDNRIGPFTIPPASIATFDVISVMVCVPVYDAVLVPLARRATGNDRGLSQLHRLSIGIALSVVVMVYASSSTTSRRTG
jgi:solute carrier family 15 (peptide/histidine transporter), member 3/4